MGQALRLEPGPQPGGCFYINSDKLSWRGGGFPEGLLYIRFSTSSMLCLPNLNEGEEGGAVKVEAI